MTKRLFLISVMSHFAFILVKVPKGVGPLFQRFTDMVVGRNLQKKLYVRKKLSK